MKLLFYCRSAYQLFNALNLSINNYRDDEVDLAILDAFPNAYDVFRNVKNLNIFKNVFLIEQDRPADVKLKLFIYLRIITLLCYHRYTIKRQCDSESYKILAKTKYDYIFSSTHNDYFLAGVVCINRQAIYNRFDDGLFSYSGNALTQFAPGGKLFGQFCKWFKVGYYASTPQCLYINNKSICQAQGINQIEQMPAFNKELSDVLYKVFEIDSTYRPNKKIILLSRPSDFVDDIYTVKKRLIGLLTPWKSDVMVRRHPREEIDDAYDGFFIDEKNEMWELFLHKINMDSVILISFGSTAMITPKMLFNKEPRIIDVSFLLGDTLNTSDNTFDLNSFCNELYENQDRVSFPKNEEEFLSSLTCYYKQVTLTD